MKKLLAVLLILLLCSSLASCSSSGSAPAQAQAPADPAPAAETAPYTAMDIFGSEFNPYADLELPDIFTIFCAEFNKGAAKLNNPAQFILSMTGRGNLYACIAYQADVAGLGLSEEEKMDLLTEYRQNGCFCEFTGTDGQIVTIRQAIPDDDRYEYVESDGSHDITGGGCVIDITFPLSDADNEKYTRLVQDNFSLEALAPLADYMDIKNDFSECGLRVNLHKNEADAYVVYYFPDVAAVRKDLENGLGSGWWEWNGLQQTSFTVGAIENKLTFDERATPGAITVEQTNREFNLPPGADVSLTKLGFGFDEAQTCGVYEERDPHYMSIAVHRPEWGAFDSDWNIEYMDEVNGYALRITYHAAEGRYHFSLEKNGESCAFETYPDKQQVGWEYPDLDTVHRMFNDAYGTKEKELYSRPLADLEALVQARFGLSLQELYALPIR